MTDPDPESKPLIMISWEDIFEHGKELHKEVTKEEAIEIFENTTQTDFDCEYSTFWSFIENKIDQFLEKKHPVEKYPDELTIDEFEKQNWIFSKQFKDEDYPARNGKTSTQNACQAVLNYVAKHGGVIYTVIDGKNDVVYSKGNHLCNRVGVWEVVRK